MKTLKFALIVAIVASTMMSLAYADGFNNDAKPAKVINITVDRAVRIPGLAAAMYLQIDQNELLKGIQQIYVAEVFFKGNLYRISGTYAQWSWFFRMDKEFPVISDPASIGTN